MPEADDTPLGAVGSASCYKESRCDALPPPHDDTPPSLKLVRRPSQTLRVLPTGSITYNQLSERLWRQMVEWVPIDEDVETPAEVASVEYATAWTLCLAAELGGTELHGRLNNFRAPLALTGFRVDPYMSGLCLLGHELDQGALHRLSPQFRAVRTSVDAGGPTPDGATVIDPVVRRHQPTKRHKSFTHE